MYYYSKSGFLPQNILISIKKYSIKIELFNFNEFCSNKPILIYGKLDYLDLEKFINYGFKKIVIISGEICDQCLEIFGYKRKKDIDIMTKFKYRLFANEIFKNVNERLPIENVMAENHFEDQWIYTGLPSSDILFNKKSKIRLLGDFLLKNISEKSSLTNRYLTLNLESCKDISLQIPLSHVVEIDNTFIQHWNISTAGFESAISVLFETFITTKVDSQDKCVMPILLESFLPKEFAIISPRLDCDEAIKSANLLYDFYSSNSINLNLAITTNQDFTKDVKQFINEVEISGGTISNHSHEHKIFWGTNNDEFQNDFNKSKEIISINSQSKSVTCVAPFHQSNEKLLRLLNKNRVQLLITGNAKYSQEHMASIGGEISSGLNIYIHSQQCMLHGNSWPEFKQIYFKSFMLNAKRQTIFGYLDHPISERYDYDWGSDQNQLNAHVEFFEFFKKNFKIYSISHIELAEWLNIRSFIEINFLPGERFDTFVKSKKLATHGLSKINIQKFNKCQILYNNEVIESRINYL